MPALTPGASRRRPARATVAAAALIALALTGCSQGAGDTQSANATPKQGGTITYGTGNGEPGCLDPHVGGNYPQKIAGMQMIESLFTMNDRGEVLPWLAKEGTVSDDGLTWTFTLKPDVRFTDGEPFDAEAVKANVLHLQNPATGSSTGYLTLQHVKEVEAKDATTAVFHMSEPDSALKESLAQTWTGMESPKALARTKQENCASPVGTGPFKLESWTKQDSITYTRNDDYASAPGDAQHQGPAYIDRLVIRFMPDASSRYAALQAGTVDVIDQAQPDTVAAAQKDANGPIRAVQASRAGATTRIELNIRGTTFSDKLVREAFMHAADVDSGVASLFFGTVKRSTSLMTTSTPYATSHDDGVFAFDQDLSRRLLDEAGWKPGADGIREKDGNRLTVKIPVSNTQSIPAEQSLLEQIQAQAKEVGFDVQLKPMDNTSWYAAEGAWDFDGIVAPYGKSSPDVMRIIFHSDGIPPAPSGYHANNIGVSDPELDDLVTRANHTTNEDERRDLYAKAQQLVIDGAYVLPLYDWYSAMLTSSRVSGFHLETNLSGPWFADAHLSEQ